VLETCQRDAPPLFEMLRERYAPSLARDPQFTQVQLLHFLAFVTACLAMLSYFVISGRVASLSTVDLRLSVLILPCTPFAYFIYSLFSHPCRIQYLDRIGKVFFHLKPQATGMQGLLGDLLGGSGGLD
jgi:hypothetical protein